MTAPDATGELETRFHALARRLRLRLALGRGLTYAGHGLAFATVSALVLVLLHRFSLSHPLWQRGGRWMRPGLGVAGVAGLAVGLAVAWRRRPNDTSVALFLDERLATNEAIVTAIDEARTSDVGRVVASRALGALRPARASELGVPIFQRIHAMVPVMIGALALLSWVPVAPKPPPPAPAPGVESARVVEVKGLQQVVALASLPARDEAQKARLERIAREAERVRDEAKNGAPERDVQSDAAKLADDIERERMSLGTGDERRGLESALDSLAKNRDLDRASKALADHDLTAFDRELSQAMRDPAASPSDRAKRALASLEQAEAAARRAGADQVAQALADERKALEAEEAARERGDPPSSEPSPEAAREEAMRAAERALGAPGPTTGNEPAAGNDQTDSQPGKQDKGPATPTGKVAAADDKLTAKAKPQGKGPMTRVGVTHMPSDGHGETANARGTGALGTVSADEISGAFQSDVPEAYRDQVGSYFHP